MHDKLKYEEPKNLTERVEIFLWNLKTLAGQIEGCMGEPADDRVVYGLTPMTYKVAFNLIFIFSTLLTLFYPSPRLNIIASLAMDDHLRGV